MQIGQYIGLLLDIKQWGKNAIRTQANVITNTVVTFPIAFNITPHIIQITLVDSALTENNLERPIGFIDNASVSEHSFILKNFSETNSGDNTYYWLSIGV